MKSTATHFAVVFTLVIVGLGLRALADDRKIPRGEISHEGFDASVRPQDDFFRYVNGGWIAQTEIPADRSGLRLVLRSCGTRANRTCARSSRRPRPSAANPPGSEARKIGDLYTSFMDEARAEELGLKPIEADLARIDAITDKAAFIRTLAAFQREGVTGLFGAVRHQRRQAVGPRTSSI